MKPDSHFGRWLAARQQHPERVPDWDLIFADEKILEAARAAYGAADVPEVLPSKWAVGHGKPGVPNPATNTATGSFPARCTCG